jgi:hypothetical protein
MYEHLLDESMKGYVFAVTLDLLETMTAMSPRAPDRLKARDIEDLEAAAVPGAAVDLSTVDDTKLSQLIGKPLKPNGVLTGSAIDRWARRYPLTRAKQSTWHSF